MVTYNNEKFRLSNGKEGHCHYHILNNIEKGDKWIDGLGTLHICTFVTREEDEMWGGMVSRVVSKKDGTPHKRRKAETFTKWRGCWDRQ